MDKNSVKKELLKSKVNATFVHYEKGKLIYNVQLEDGLYQFPVSTIEDDKITVEDEDADLNLTIPTIKLSNSIGQTKFKPLMKASELNRWVEEAIEKNDFIKLTE